MKLLSFICLGTLFLSACSNSEKTADTLPAPKSIESIIGTVKGKQYKSEKMGLVSVFTMDTLHPINWNIKDTSAFYRNYAKNQLAFTATFSTDSAISITNTNDVFAANTNSKNIKGIYKFDENANLDMNDKNERTGIKLRVVYQDSIDFGGSKTASTITQSYLVRGINDKEIILETTSEFNRQKVAIWMRAE